MRPLGYVVLTAFFLAGIAPAHGQDTLRTGVTAPDFTLPAADKDSIFHGAVHLKEILPHAPIVLAFYPADWSGGCTKEMCSIRDGFGALTGAHAVVLGISGDYVFSHHAWAQSLQLPFTLLSDHAHEVAKAYQSYNSATGHNVRTVFVVDRRGIITYVDRAYNVSSSASYNALASALSSSAH